MRCRLLAFLCPRAVCARRLEQKMQQMQACYVLKVQKLTFYLNLCPFYSRKTYFRWTSHRFCINCCPGGKELNEHAATPNCRFRSRPGECSERWHSPVGDFHRLREPHPGRADHHESSGLGRPWRDHECDRTFRR